MNKASSVNDTIVSQYKNNNLEKNKAKDTRKNTAHNKRSVEKLSKAQKSYASSQVNSLKTAKKNQKIRKVNKSLYPKLDSVLKVRNFIDSIITGCNIILGTIDSDIDKAKRQITELKNEIEYLAKEIKIENSNEILSDLNINFTALEKPQDLSIDIKTITENHIKKAQSSLKEIYKKIQSTSYIRYNKPKIILIIRYILECFRSLFNYISKAVNAKTQDQDKIADKQEKFTTADKTQQSCETNLDIEHNKQDDQQDEDYLAEDSVHFDSREFLTDNDIKNSQDAIINSKTQLAQTVNISNSILTNYGNTCWLNSSIKVLYVLYKDAITTKAENLLKNPQVIPQEKQLYTSILELFNKLETQEDASQEISKLLMHMFIYGRSVASSKNAVSAIKNIYGLIQDMKFTVKIDPDNENKEIINFDLSSVKQCSADEFIQNFIDFMGLNDDSNSVREINFEDRYLNKDLLNQIGLADTNKPKSIKRNKMPEYRSSLLSINNEDRQAADTNKDDVIKLLSDDSNINDFSKEEKRKITDFLVANDIDSNQGLVEVGYTREFIANIEQLKTITVNLQAATAQNSFIKNKERLDQLFDERYPYITFNVLNSSDNQMYKVTAKAISCVAHKGAAMTAGHYIACSIDESNQVAIHNDRDNYKLQTTKNLQDFIKKEGFTPVVIGYAITDKQLIG